MMSPSFQASANLFHHRELISLWHLMALHFVGLEADALLQDLERQVLCSVVDFDLIIVGFSCLHCAFGSGWS